MSYSAALFDDYSSMSKPGDWKNVAEYLISNESLQQTIVVFPPDSALPLSYYYSGKNAVVQIPRELDVENYDPREFVLKDLDTVRELLTEKAGGRGIWLVTTPGVDSFFAGGLNSFLLEEAVDNYFKVESSRNFSHSTVRLLRVGQVESPPTSRAGE